MFTFCIQVYLVLATLPKIHLLSVKLPVSTVNRQTSNLTYALKYVRTEICLFV